MQAQQIKLISRGPMPSIVFRWWASAYSYLYLVLYLSLSVFIYENLDED
jgi:hypothetical protein